MQISTTKRAVQYNNINRAPQAEEGQQQDPKQGTLSNQIIDSLVTSPDFSKKALSKMGSGGSMTITDSSGNAVVTIKTEGPSLAQRFLDGSSKIMANASQEVVRVMDADPAFAFKSTAEAVQTRVVANFDSDTKKTLEPFILPVLRGGMLAMDTKRAISTYQNKDASVWEKGVDIAHVVTDVVGLAGAVGKGIPIPFVSQHADVMTGIGLVGDLAAVSFHAMGYLTERGQVNLDSMDQIFSSKAAKREAAKAAKEAEQQAKQDHTQVSVNQ